MTSKKLPAKRGKRKAKPKSAQELQRIAKEARERSQQARQHELDLRNKAATEEALHELMEVGDALKNKTLKELLEIQKHIHRLWNHYLNALDAEQELGTPYGLSDIDYEAVYTPDTRMLTEAEWDDLHKDIFRTPRKNAKKVKSIFDIQRNRYKDYGLAPEPADAIDVEAIEAELEHKALSRQEPVKKKKAPRPLVGIRVKERPTTSRQPTKSYWN